MKRDVKEVSFKHVTEELEEEGFGVMVVTHSRIRALNILITTTT